MGLSLPPRPKVAPAPPPPATGYPNGDDLEIRTEALDQAVQSYARTQYATTADIIGRATDFEQYLRGDK